MADRLAPPMARNFVDGLGYTVHRDILLAEDCKTTWGKVEKIWGAGNQVPQHFDPVFNVKPVEEQRKDPTLPQRYQSKPSKTGGLASALITKFVNSINDRVPDPFEGLFDMPCSVIVSGVESGDQLPHTDVSTAPDMLPAPDRNPSSCHISTFVALSPQYRINVRAGTALGEATEERWDEVLLQQGEVLVLVSTARHHGLPPPPGQEMQGALFTQWTPDRCHLGVKPNTTHLDPPLPLELKDCLGLLDGEGGEDVPTFGQLLLLGVGLEARVGLATRDMVDDVFCPPRGGARPPRVHTPPSGPEPLLPRHLPRHRARGGNLDVEWGVRDAGREGGLDGQGRGGDVGTWGYTAPPRARPPPGSCSTLCRSGSGQRSPRKGRGQ